MRGTDPLESLISHPGPSDTNRSTANVYSNGQSEVVLGKALKEIGAPRESYVVLTKVSTLSSGI